jgi:excinuclease UvrABC helicase subunit UvrB
MKRASSWASSVQSSSPVIEAVDRPTRILSHNKTLASQLYQVFRSDGGANGKTLVTCF